MNKSLINLGVVILGITLMAVKAVGVDVNLDGVNNKVWSGSANIKPSANYTPQQLVAMGNAAPSWVYSEDYCDDVDGQWWVTRYDADDYNWNYMLFKWKNNNYDEAICRWRVRVDSLKVVHLFYWTGTAWDHISNNGGGWTPSAIYVNVTNYFGQEHLLLLCQGYTPDSGDNDMDCDVCDLDVDP